MAPFLALALALAAAAAPPPDTTPLVFGGLAARIRDQELAGILRAVEASSPPVALYAHAAQTLPWTWFVDVFLPPAESAPGARVVRGPVEHLKCIPDDTARCLEWVPSARQSSYAQVRIGSSTKGAAAPGNGTMQERPFEVIGDLSDADLLALVAYVRTGPSPRPRDGWESTGLSATDPIFLILKNRNGTVDVLLSEHGNSGETGRMKRTRTGWEVIQVTDWVH